MKFHLMLTDDAVQDIQDIDAFISSHDSLEKADYVLNMLEESISSLASMPERGAYPKELLELGIKEYREVFFKPYRVIYRIIDDTVFVYIISDGRRDMQALLARRLLAL